MSEIVSYDSANNALWVVGLVGIDVLNASTGAFVDHIDARAWGGANSVAVHNGLAAVAIENGSGSQLDDEAIKRGIYDDARRNDKGVEPETCALVLAGLAVLAGVRRRQRQA